jgi:hypothetical protein
MKQISKVNGFYPKLYALQNVAQNDLLATCTYSHCIIICNFCLHGFPDYIASKGETRYYIRLIGKWNIMGLAVTSVYKQYYCSSLKTGEHLKIVRKVSN